MSPYFMPLGDLLEDKASSVWTLYVLCNDSNPLTAEILLKASEMCAADKISFRNRLKDLHAKSKMDIMQNNSFHNVYDEKEFHESFSYSLKTGGGNTITVKVLRLRKSNIRIFLFYPKGIPKTAIILSTLSKRENKLSKKDEDYLKTLVDSTVPYWDSTHGSYADISTRVFHRKENS